MNILIINGPNLNMLGQRQKKIYGRESWLEIFEELKTGFKEHHIDYYQTNHEGEVVDRLQQLLKEDVDGLIINPAGFSHTSVSIHDALKMLSIPVIEVHLSHVYEREDFRQKLVTARAADALISGMGKHGYHLAISYLIKREKNVSNH